MLAESFPKGFASRLLPGRAAARPGGEGYRHAHVPNARLQTKRWVSGRRLPTAVTRGLGPGGDPASQLGDPNPGPRGTFCFHFPQELSVARRGSPPGTVAQGHSRSPYFKDVPL